MKKYLLSFCLILFAVSGYAQKKVIDKVVATVGGELVLLSDVEEQYALLSAQNGAIPEDARCGILDQLLAQKLLLNQSKLDSIEVTEEEVEAQLNARIERILSYMNNDISQFEAYYGQSIGEVKEQFREDLKSQILTDRMRGEIMNGVSVTPAEVKNFFAKIPIDSLPYFNSEVEIGEIVFKPEVNDEEKNKAIDQLREIRRQIMEDGIDFAELAKKWSDDGSARSGGELGWTTRGKFVPEFEAVAYKLEKDEISEVVESEFGFHIIQLQERRGNSIKVRHILIKPDITDEDLSKAATHLDSVRSLIVVDSMNFSRAVKRFSNEDVQSFNNDGRMVNPVTGNTFFEIGDLEPDIYFTIDTMDIGALSSPFEYRDPATGEAMYRIIQLQSRSAPHKANLAQDYSKIQKATIDSKRNEFINTWIDDKVNSTYIAIDAMYNGCPMVDKWKKKDIRP